LDVRPRCLRFSQMLGGDRPMFPLEDRGQIRKEIQLQLTGDRLGYVLAEFATADPSLDRGGQLLGHRHAHLPGPTEWAGVVRQVQHRVKTLAQLWRTLDELAIDSQETNKIRIARPSVATVDWFDRHEVMLPPVATFAKPCVRRAGTRPRRVGYRIAAADEVHTRNGPRLSPRPVCDRSLRVSCNRWSSRSPRRRSSFRPAASWCHR